MTEFLFELVDAPSIVDVCDIHEYLSEVLNKWGLGEFPEVSVYLFKLAYDLFLTHADIRGVVKIACFAMQLGLLLVKKGFARRTVVYT